LARKSGKVSANNNAKDASFQLVRLNDQINALKKQLQNEQFNNEENVVNLQKSQLVRIRFSSFSCANGYFFLNFFFFFFFFLNNSDALNFKRNWRLYKANWIVS
jgi:hypothetical protein